MEVATDPRVKVLLTINDMIITGILTMLAGLLSLLFSQLPIVSELPYGLDTFISSGVSGARSLATVFPPITTLFIAFGFYLFYKLTMIILKLFLGHRTK